MKTPPSFIGFIGDGGYPSTTFFFLLAGPAQIQPNNFRSKLFFNNPAYSSTISACCSTISAAYIPISGMFYFRSKLFFNNPAYSSTISACSSTISAADIPISGKSLCPLSHLCFSGAFVGAPGKRILTSGINTDTLKTEMADAVIGLLAENLNSLIQKGLGPTWGIQEDINRLASLLSTIQAVLQDAEMREFAEKSIANWLKKLKDTAYDADDVLDEWLTYAPDSTSALSYLSPSYINFRLSIAKKVKKIMTRFDEIAGERLKFHLNPGVAQTALQLYESRETVSTLTEDVVYGRDADKEKITNMLLSNVSRAEDVSVLSILGIGGLGKTTLAQFVYKDKRIVEHFDAQIWVCVSTDFEMKNLIRMMLESLTLQACNLNNLDPLERELQGKLRGKRFLLVLDDVWNEDPEKWHRLKSLLTCGAKGSSILVTTRLETVASIVGPLSPHCLTILSEEDCWYLFRGHAFGVGNEENADLAEIGKQIVKKCGGVPLAAKSLGGLLFSTREVNDWLQVKDNNIWELPQIEVNGILPSLRLSYKYLPSNIKQCFAFCSIYPKDYEMKKEELIHLWLAHGFLQSDGRMELEDVGNQVFIELLRRSFFQDIETDEFGEIRTCKMHDLIHDLACSVSVNECCILEVGKVDKFRKGIRHGSLFIDSYVVAEGAELSNLVLRTLLLVGHSRHQQEFGHINLNKFYSLRALDLSGTGVKSVPSSVGRMIHLRYLNLFKTKIKYLPESICNLRNLQSLKLRDCYYLKKLPKNMSKMSSLRHLEIEGCSDLAEMPISMGQLTQLRTLSFFVVGIERGRDITELHGMNHLRGELKIERLEQVRNVDEAKEVKLLTKRSVTSLSLSWKESGVVSSSGAGGDAESQEKVLEELQPPPYLKALNIRGFKGVVLPSWMGLLQHLVKIRLEGCNSCERLPPLGKLPLLRVLTILAMDSVKCIGDDFYGERVVVVGGSAAIAVQGCCSSWFPSLQKLEINGMGALEEWSSPSSEENHRNTTQAFPCLVDLSIGWCPKLKAIPSIPHLQNLELTGCDKLEAIPCLSCVQNIRLSRCNEMILRSIPNLGPRSLLTLEIQNFKEMTHLPEGTFINSSSSTATLQSLQIVNCTKLKSVSGEIQNLTALTSLKISLCREMDSLSELEGLLGKLTSLTHLSIRECSSLKCLPVMGIQGFNSSLTDLNISFCENLTSVSKGLQYLTSLRNLFISNCTKLEFTSRDDQEGDGFQHLISLQSLTFLGLPKVRALPEGMQYLTMLKSLRISCYELRMLPEWLQHLTSLQSLFIFCNYELRKRCKEKSDYWHLISHIPDICIC